MNKIYRLIDTIVYIALIILVILEIIMARNNLNQELIQYIVYIFFTIYVLVKVFLKKPLKIIRTRLDICIIVLIVSTILPIFFNTYISLNDTVEHFLKYIELFIIYVLFREILYNNCKRIIIIENTLIILTIILGFIGIDNLTSNIVPSLLNMPDFINGESRLVSLFGNPNILGIYIASILFLSISLLINAKSLKLKIIYCTCNTLLLIFIILTYSKGVFLILAVMLLLYIILNLKQSNIQLLLQNLIISLAVSIVYILIFNKLVTYELFILIWIITFLLIIILLIINYIIVLLNKNKKLSNYITIVMFIFIIGYLIVGFNWSTSWNVFEYDTVYNYETRKIYNIKGNEIYNLSFDMESTGKSVDKEIFSIEIIPRDKRNNQLCSEIIEFSEFKGKKNVVINTQNETNEFKIVFRKDKETINSQLIIKALYINDTKIPLKYKLLPQMLVDKVKNINIEYKTAQERLVIFSDVFELSKSNMFLGIGGNGWFHSYGQVQEYNYGSLDTHSYFMQILLEYGFIGIISYIGIILFILYRGALLIKNRNDKYRNINIGVIFSLLILILHSTIDSEMYYMYMLIFLFMLYSMVASQCKDLELKINVKVQIILLLAIGVIPLLLLLNPSIYDKKEIITKYEKEISSYNGDMNEYRLINEKLYNAYQEFEMYEKDSINMRYYSNSIKALINSNLLDKEKCIEKYYDILKQYNNKFKFDSERIIAKNDVCMQIIETLLQHDNVKYYLWVVKFSNLIIEEYQQVHNQLLELISTQYNNVRQYEVAKRIIEYNYIKALEYVKNPTYIYGVKINNTSNKSISLNNVNSKMINKKMILYSTHTTESYNNRENAYKEISFAKTLNEEYNMLKVSRYMKELLIKKGYNVLHLDEYYDKIKEENAYKMSYEGVSHALEKNKDIEVIFDIHRDSYGKVEKNGKVIEIGGEKTAQLMFVIGAENEKWEDNLSWAISVQKEADKLYPGLFRPILIRNDTYNQELAKYSTLIEVGENNNTLEEALNAIECLVDVIDRVINN